MYASYCHISRFLKAKIVNNMLQLTKQSLKNRVVSILKKQGYIVSAQGFVLRDTTLEAKRDVHVFAKMQKVNQNEEFILKNVDLIKKHLVDGKDLEIEKIDPQIIEIKVGSKYEKIFRWWNLVWWSLPYERAYGRQMRLVVWDRYHNAPIGLIGLQSPILSWSVRDEYLGIDAKGRDFWVNQSMSAQRLGALPPYNYILGGKLVASLMTSSVLAKKIEDKYAGKITILKNRNLPSKPLFITTTGAYGKSSVYNRLKFYDQPIAKFIGYTKGSGSFHIPDSLYEDFIKYLGKKDYDVRRGYGSGPSKKVRIINEAMDYLGFSHGSTHGVKRAVYLFPLVKNLQDVIQKNKKPIRITRKIVELTDCWRQRWALPRTNTHKEYLDFSGNHFMQKTLTEIEGYKKLCKTNK